MMLTVPAKKAENPQNTKNPARTAELDVVSLDSEKVGGTVLCIVNLSFEGGVIFRGV